MKCPFCSSNTKVLRTKSRISTVSRRRKCLDCGKAFNTFEVIATEPMRVAKSDNERVEDFDVRKIVRVIERVSKGCGLSADETREVARQVESALLREEQTVVRSDRVARILIDRLALTSKMAASRFAANYVDKRGRLVLMEHAPEQGVRQYPLFGKGRGSTRSPFGSRSEDST